VLSKQFVLKKIDLKQASAKDRKSAEQESKLLSQLKHPNIVSYRDSYEKDGILHIIMGFCEGGDLYNLLQKEYKLKHLIVEERQIVQWLIQIAMALEYLHDRNILHRDLKTQNIFLTKQQQVIKVGDLGIARVLSNNEDMAKTFTRTTFR
jgi:NIMA (never in mitosis gene a)-related kinase 1/4/5